MPKSNAEICREYRKRKKEANKIKKVTDISEKQRNALKSRMYRLRKKMLALGHQSSTTPVLYAPFTPNSHNSFVSTTLLAATEESYAKEPMDYQGISEVLIENNLGCIRWDDKLAVEKGLQTSGAEEIIVSDDLNNVPIEYEPAPLGEDFKKLEAGVVIHRVYKYLQKEYEDLKALKAFRRCDLSPLGNILKRTAEATGVSELVVTTMVIAHGSDKEPPSGGIMLAHNFHRKQSKREKDVVRLKAEITEEECINEGGSVECSRADVSRGNVEELTLKCEVFQEEEYVLPETPPPACKISKCPAKRNRDDRVRLKQKKIKALEGKQNEEKAIKKRAYRMRQKYNKMNAQVIPSPEYKNRDDVKMEIEEYTFILFEPSDEPTTDDPMGVNIKVEPQEYS